MTAQTDGTDHGPEARGRASGPAGDAAAAGAHDEAAGTQAGSPSDVPPGSGPAGDGLETEASESTSGRGAHGRKQRKAARGVGSTVGTIASQTHKVAHAGRPRQRVAVIIPAKDEGGRIAATVRSARAIPHVDLVLVVDDGSADNTQHVAREAGAVVVRHSHNRGKAAAMETGAAIVAMRDTEDRPPRLLLFIDGDLGDSAVNTAPLVPPVFERAADMSIALLPPQVGAGGRGIVVGAARRAITSLTGWTPTQPLSGMRCLTRAAFEAATPLARGWGVETGMTIDLLRQGFVAVEVPCDLRHRPSGTDLKGQLHRAAQYRDVMLAVANRRVRGAAGAIRDKVTPVPPTHR